MSFRTLFKVGMTLALMALLALPATAGDSVIFSGADLWESPGNGSTYTDFGDEPIPAGFFCADSSAFDGRIVFEGAPLATKPANALGDTDTIVLRLKDAVFDEFGVARTPIQLVALSFVSLEPVQTECGSYDVRVNLAGDQPITEMQIIRTREDGGFFLAPIHARLALTFQSQDGNGDALEISREVTFAPSGDALWSSQPGEGGIEQSRTVQVDTNGDGNVDQWVAGTSNFAAGWGIPAGASPGPAQAAFVRHCDDPPECTKMHGTMPTNQLPDPY